jgi:3-hydroxyacyl-[acyl-carrier-protein] dehydratase
VVGERARGLKSVTLTDEVLHDHFPDYPVFPGVLVVEALAQLGGFLLEKSSSDPFMRAILARIERAKFSSPAGPGDQLDLRVAITQRMEAAAQLACDAFVGERRIASAQLTFMMKRIDSVRLREQREALYRIWTRDLNDAVPLAEAARATEAAR